mmetsp:Transcript_23677/g.44723  ORF Transcript_23677/g.44723 Transcript_23677/m.44723 type:complete len:249 (+) Transcript_23677:90-836(+)
MVIQPSSLPLVWLAASWPGSLGRAVTYSAGGRVVEGTADAMDVPAWPQLASGRLCHSAPFVYVTSREECQKFAEKLHHDFYAHRTDLRPERCITFESCVSQQHESSGLWTLYQRPREGAGHPSPTSTCADTWLPDWTDNATLACQKWSKDHDWGALQEGRTLRQACARFWAQLNCAKTCGCEAKDQAEFHALPCKDSWTTSWAPNSSYACAKWAEDQEWGALQNGSLEEACHGPWAKEHCAKTCGCTS